MSRLSILLVSSWALAACTDNARFFQRTDLVSDRAGLAARTDAALVNPWGLAADDENNLWVANNGTGVITVYDADGQPSDEYAPVDTGLDLTGAVFNDTGAFSIAGGGDVAPAELVFATENGSLVGFTDKIRTLTAIPYAAPASAFTGVALGPIAGGARLFAADFAGKQVVMFDTNFTPIGAMADPALPPEYGPFGIQRIDDRLYVAYAVVGGDGDEQAGRGLGIISRFFLDGTFDRRIATAGDLDAPWAIARAPSGFGKVGGDLIVGNFGDGTILAIDEDSGAIEGPLESKSGQPILVDKVWGLAFVGNSLFFAAGVEDEQHGLFGRIDER